MQGLLIAMAVYPASIALIKTSTLFLLHRVFPSPRLTPYLWALGILIQAYSLVLGVTIMTQCIPLEALWNPMAAMNARCFKISTVFIVTSSLNALTDLILLAIPMPFLWKLNMDYKRKLQLTGIFICGGMVFAISIARAPMLVNVSPVDPSCKSYCRMSFDAFHVHADTLLGSDVNGGIWSALESGVGTLCACLPTFGVLFTAIRTRTQKSSYRYRIDDSESVRGLSANTPGVSGHSTPGKNTVNGKEIRVTVQSEEYLESGDAMHYGVALSDMSLPRDHERVQRATTTPQSPRRYG